MGYGGAADGLNVPGGSPQPVTAQAGCLKYAVPGTTIVDGGSHTVMKEQSMKVISNSFADNATIPDAYAFGIPDPKEHMTMGPNKSPHLVWSDAPGGTKSFVMLCVDVDVPTVFDNFNVEGKSIDKDMPRQSFMHGVLVDIPPSITELAEGAESEGVVPKGKPIGKVDHGVRGANAFGAFMADNPDMAGDYGGYDGPAPPWNDELPHRYEFRVYALDVETLGLSGPFTGEQALEKMQGHILAEAKITGVFTLNPDLR